jgi:hypothetical protein
MVPLTFLSTCGEQQQQQQQQQQHTAALKARHKSPIFQHVVGG